ncbi:MAG: DNA mismatch repair endonuclease MutL [Planctomycetaceae bacterium]|jgi:DNA mismatch repair protein MutL|nr:DNA mismatch repair endonuclease MutL [Planctomycetaceae bacterium]
MNIIRTLSQSMINKIAAGEVIERPASVLKELVENSIDAGSTRIDIAIDKGGTDLLRVVDNGCGIDADQLVLALSPHATSKITDSDDLFRIGTFGFRGEALASIAEISQMSIKSRVSQSNEGAEIHSNGGERTTSVPCGIPVGSQIEVRNLFFNTPVRRKYMKSITTELGHITETFIRLVLPHPAIHFTLKHNGRVLHDLPPEEAPLNRIRQLFGEDITRDLIYVENRDGAAVRVRGLVSHPNQSRSNNRMQYFFLNKRYIRDRALQHALGEAYRGILLTGRFPIAFLQIEMSPDMFDVNVHPTKMEVRFLDSNRIYSDFLGTIREKFLNSDLRNKFHAGSLEKTTAQTGTTSASGEHLHIHSAAAHDPNDPRTALAHSATKETRKHIQDWIEQISRNKTSEEPEKTNHSSATSPNSDKSDSDVFGSDVLGSNKSDSEVFGSDKSDSDVFGSTSRFSNTIGGKELSFHALPDRPALPEPVLPEPALPKPVLPESVLPEQTEKNLSSSFIKDDSNNVADKSVLSDFQKLFSDRVAYSPHGKLVVQMHNRYLIMETLQGIALIDQHALHERVLYERLKEKMNEGQLESQRLLIPIPVDLSPNELACAMEHVEFFQALGLYIEPFGGETMLISAFPSILSKTPPMEILMSLLEPLLEAGKKLDRTEMLDGLLHSMACKAAIKAGDQLRSDAISQLIMLAEKEVNAHHCPHGRPSILLFSCEELDKMFKRT